MWALRLTSLSGGKGGRGLLWFTFTRRAKRGSGKRSPPPGQAGKELGYFEPWQNLASKRLRGLPVRFLSCEGLWNPSEMIWVGCSSGLMPILQLLILPPRAA